MARVQFCLHTPIVYFSNVEDNASCEYRLQHVLPASKKDLDRKYNMRANVKLTELTEESCQATGSHGLTGYLFSTQRMEPTGKMFMRIALAIEMPVEIL
jgi:hypothetical protein